MHLLTQSALLQALGWSLFNSLWQMGLLWLSYQLFILIFKEVSSQVRHGLSLLLLAIGALWSAGSLAVTYFQLTDEAGHDSMLPVLAPLRSLIAVIIPYGSSLYLLILAGLLVRYCYYYFQSMRLTHTGLTRIQPQFRIFVEETARRMGVQPKVRVWLSSLVKVPVTLGFLKPVILIPLAMVSHLTQAQIEAILVHELAHIRRKDFLINLCVTMLEGLFFFNPFTRWMIADLRKERENSCDDLVLQFRYDPHTYVSALLSVARQSQQTALVVAATGNGNNQLLLQRARRILHQERTGDRPGARPFALLVVTLLVAGITLSRPARTTPPPPVAKTDLILTSHINHDHPALPGSASSVETGQTLAVVPPPSRPTPLARPKPAPKVAEQDPSDDDAPSLLLVNAVADARWAPKREMAAVVIPEDDREYSLNKAKSFARIPGKEEGQPFVPKASWSFQLIEEDTLRPEEKLAQLQVQTQREIALHMQKLQLELLSQLEVIKNRQAALQAADMQAGLEGLKQQQILIEQQLQLQRQYLQKWDELQKKAKKMHRVLTIVYI